MTAEELQRQTECVCLREITWFKVRVCSHIICTTINLCESLMYMHAFEGWKERISLVTHTLYEEVSQASQFEEKTKKVL